MAKIQYSAVIGDIRGKLGGSQFSKNRSGNIFQNKPNRKQNSSSGQSTYRSNFAYLSKYWNGISVADKAANAAAALNYPYVDKFGVTRYFSGYQLLLRSNLNRLMSGLAPISVVQSTPPDGLTLVLGGVDIIQYGEEGRIFVFDIDSVIGEASDYDLQFFFGNPVGNGTEVYSKNFLFTGNRPPAVESVIFNKSVVPLINYWGIGQKVFMKIVVIHKASGIEVSSYIISDIVAS